jgi:hypothetical protein
MKLNKITLSIIMLIALNCFAQEAKWTRIDFEKNLFSAIFPTDMIVDAEKVEGNRKFKIWSYGGELNVNLIAYKNDRAKEYLKNMRVGGSLESDQTDVGDVYARKFVFRTDGFYSAQIYLASKKGLYYFSFTADKVDSPKLVKFFNSFKTQGKAIFPAEKPSAEEPEISLIDTDLKSSPQVVTALNRVPNNLTGNYDVDRVTRSMNTIRKPSQMNRFPIILRDPEPKSGKIKGQFVVVRVQLMANVDTGEVKVYTDADDKGVFAAVDAVRKMKFLPAQLNGKNVDSYFVYMFNAEVTDGSSGIIN